MGVGRCSGVRGGAVEDKSIREGMDVCTVWGISASVEEEMI